jgi:hypothetical protein
VPPGLRLLPEHAARSTRSDDSVAFVGCVEILRITAHKNVSTFCQRIIFFAEHNTTQPPHKYVHTLTAINMM